MECCEFTSPTQIGDAAAVIEIRSGSPDWVDDIEIFAEACYNEDGSTGYTDTYEELGYGDVTEGGLFPNATATATYYQLIRMPPNSTLTIDATARMVTLVDSDTELAIGGLETLEFNNLWRWISASRGGCQRICIDGDEAHCNGDTTIRVLSFQREI